MHGPLNVKCEMVAFFWGSCDFLRFLYAYASAVL